MAAVTADQVARAALDAINTDAGLIRAVKFVSHRYRELTNNGRLRALRKVGEVYIPAVIDTGTVTTTRDSNIVTGSAAAQAVWPSDIIGRYFRATNNWYKIENVIGGELRLASKFAETAVSAGSYKIAQRFVPLKPEARYLGSFVSHRLMRKLQTQTVTDLDINFPERITTSAAGPQTVTDFGYDENGVRVVEFYPYPNESEMISYIYWEQSPDLQVGDLLPYSVDEYALKEGVLIDLMRYEMAKSIRAGQIEQAAVWRNEYRAQETRWEEFKRQMLKADKGVDDVTMILRRAGIDTTTDGVIKTAREEIWARGDRP